MKGADLKGLAGTIERAASVAQQQIDNHVTEAKQQLDQDAAAAKAVVVSLHSGLEVLAKFVEGRNALAGILPTSEMVISGEVVIARDTEIEGAHLRTSERYGPRDGAVCYFEAGWGLERRLAPGVKAGKYRVVTILVREP